RIGVDAAALVDEQAAQVVDAVRVIGVLMGEQHAVEPVHIGVQQLFAQVRAGVDKYAGHLAGAVASLDQHGAASPPVFWIGWIAFAPAECGPRHAARGTAAKNGERQRHAARAVSRGTFENSRKKFSVVMRAISSSDTPRTSAKTLAVSTTYAGSLRLPRNLPGARYGASVATRMRLIGNSWAMEGRSLEFLKVRIRVKETWGPSLMARRARSGPPVKQCSTAGKAPFPVSSSRIRAVSSSASREWITSGSLVARAAAMCVRKPCSCAARGLKS